MSAVTARFPGTSTAAATSHPPTALLGGKPSFASAAASPREAGVPSMMSSGSAASATVASAVRSTLLRLADLMVAHDPTVTSVAVENALDESGLRAAFERLVATGTTASPDQLLGSGGAGTAALNHQGTTCMYCFVYSAPPPELAAAEDEDDRFSEAEDARNLPSHMGGAGGDDPAAAELPDEDPEEEEIVPSTVVFRLPAVLGRTPGGMADGGRSPYGHQYLHAFLEHAEHHGGPPSSVFYVMSLTQKPAVGATQSADTAPPSVAAPRRPSFVLGQQQPSLPLAAGGAPTAAPLALRIDPLQDLVLGCIPFVVGDDATAGNAAARRAAKDGSSPGEEHDGLPDALGRRSPPDGSSRPHGGGTHSPPPVDDSAAATGEQRRHADPAGPRSKGPALHFLSLAQHLLIHASQSAADELVVGEQSEGGRDDAAATSATYRDTFAQTVAGATAGATGPDAAALTAAKAVTAATALLHEQAAHPSRDRLLATVTIAAGRVRDTVDDIVDSSLVAERDTASELAALIPITAHYLPRFVQHEGAVVRRCVACVRRWADMLTTIVTSRTASSPTLPWDGLDGSHSTGRGAAGSRGIGAYRSSVAAQVSSQHGPLQEGLDWARHERRLRDVEAVLTSEAVAHGVLPVVKYAARGDAERFLSAMRRLRHALSEAADVHHHLASIEHVFAPLFALGAPSQTAHATAAAAVANSGDALTEDESKGGGFKVATKVKSEGDDDGAHLTGKQGTAHHASSLGIAEGIPATLAVDASMATLWPQISVAAQRALVGLPAMIHHIYLAHGLLLYYNQPANVERFLYSLAAQVIQFCKNYITEKGPVWQLPEPPLAMAVRFDFAAKLCALCRSEFHARTFHPGAPSGPHAVLGTGSASSSPSPASLRHIGPPPPLSLSASFGLGPAVAQPPHKIDELAVFGKLELFSKRVEKLGDLFRTVHTFSVLRKHDLEGVDPLVCAFTAAFDDLRRRSGDPLDHTKPTFDKDLAEFKKVVHELDCSLQVYVNSSFENLNGTMPSLALLRKYLSILHRESLRADLYAKLVQLFTRFGQDIESVQRLYEAAKADPPVSRVATPVAGRILWARHLFHEIETPMEVFRQVDPSLLISRRETKRVIVAYNRVAAALVAYEQCWVQAFVDSIPIVRTALAASALVGDRFVVNFDPALAVFAKEVRWLLRLRCGPLPSSIRDVLLHRDLSAFAFRLKSCIGQFELAAAKVHPELQPSIAPFRRAIEMECLSVGRSTITWNSPTLPEFVSNCEVVVAEFIDWVQRCNDILENRVLRPLHEVTLAEFVVLQPGKAIDTIRLYLAKHRAVPSTSNNVHLVGTHLPAMSAGDGDHDGDATAALGTGRVTLSAGASGRTTTGPPVMPLALLTDLLERLSGYSGPSSSSQGGSTAGNASKNATSAMAKGLGGQSGGAQDGMDTSTTTGGAAYDDDALSLEAFAVSQRILSEAATAALAALSQQVYEATVDLISTLSLPHYRHVQGGQLKHRPAKPPPQDASAWSPSATVHHGSSAASPKPSDHHSHGTNTQMSHLLPMQQHAGAPAVPRWDAASASAFDERTKLYAALRRHFFKAVLGAITRALHALKRRIGTKPLVLPASSSSSAGAGAADVVVGNGYYLPDGPLFQVKVSADAFALPGAGNVQAAAPVVLGDGTGDATPAEATLLRRSSLASSVGGDRSSVMAGGEPRTSGGSQVGGDGTAALFSTGLVAFTPTISEVYDEVHRALKGILDIGTAAGAWIAPPGSTAFAIADGGIPQLVLPGSTKPTLVVPTSPKGGGGAAPPLEQFPPFHAEVVRNAEVCKAVLVLSGSMKALSRRAVDFCGTFDRFTFLFRRHRTDVLRAFLSAKPSIEDFDMELAGFDALQSEVSLIPDSCAVAAFAVNTVELKARVLSEAKRWRLGYAEGLRSMLEDEVAALVVTSEHFLRVLGAPLADSVYGLLSEVEAITSSRDADWSCEVELQRVDAGIAILERCKLKLHFDLVDKVFDLRGRWRRLRAVASEKQTQVLAAQGAFRRELVALTAKLSTEILCFRNDYEANGPTVPGLTPHEAIERLKRYGRSLEEKRRRWLRLSQTEELYNIPVHQFPELARSVMEVTMLEQLYSLYTTVSARMVQVRCLIWSAVNARELSEETVKYRDSLSALPHAVRPWAAYVEMRRDVSSLLDSLPVIEQLKQPAIRERHWKEVMRLCGSTWQVDDTLTLGAILDAGIAQRKEEILELTMVSEKESELEGRLNGVAREWKEKELIFAEFKHRGFLLLKSDEANKLREQLEESLVVLGATLANRHCGPFRADASAWSMRLSSVVEALSLWLEVQGQWLNLESVFTSGDIVKQLPHESKRFATVDKQWVKIMAKAVDVRNVLDFCFGNDMLKALPGLRDQLEACQRALATYLEQKRSVFPRFFFLSDALLLEILSQANSDPLSVQPHLAAIFDGVCALVVEGSRGGGGGDGGGSSLRRSVRVRSVQNAAGETVPLTDTVVCSGNVEDWLLNLSAETTRGVQGVLHETMSSYGSMRAGTTTLMDFLFSHPSQCVAAVLQIGWVTDVTAGLANPKFAERRECTLQLQGSRDGLTEVAREPKLSAVQRRHLENLMILAVHNVEVWEAISRKAKDPYSFDWLRQLRHYWTDRGSCNLRIADAEIDYGYELLDVRERLVITPLTDRVYLSLSQAISMHLGGAPAGPAGTGKTETVKDLGRTAAKYVVVFNCSDQFDVRSMAKIFKGLAQSGSWGCFDEFNRIALSVLSVVAQQVQCVLLAVKSRKPDFVFSDGTPCKIMRSTGIFVTMNPGYAGRYELPENLKALFRSVAMMVPDRQAIMRVKLASAGFRSDTILARKFSTLYQMCEQQLSSQRHYDFGLRNILSVLRTAADAMRRETIAQLVATAKRAEAYATAQAALLAAQQPGSSEHPQSPAIMPSVPQPPAGPSAAQVARDEEALFCRTVRDMNLAKLVAGDVPVFLSLLSDFFPGRVEDALAAVEAASAAAGGSAAATQLVTMTTALKSAASYLALDLAPSVLLKCMQLHESKLVRHGIMLVGPAGSGKTSVASVLLKALSDVERRHREIRLNPKAVTAEQLFGRMDPTSSGDWIDGVFSHLWRKANREKNVSIWLTCDGPIDTLWVESLNTVLDDNKLLTLANGDRIAMSPTLRVLFEVEQLDKASPATVSRAGIVYISQEDLPTSCLWHARCDKMQRERAWSAMVALTTQRLCAAHVDAAFGRVVSTASKRTQALRLSGCTVTSTLLSMLQSPLEELSKLEAQQRGAATSVTSPSSTHAPSTTASSSASSVLNSSGVGAPDPVDIVAAVTRAFFFALAWAVGGPLDDEGRHTVATYVHDALLAESILRQRQLAAAATSALVSITDGSDAAAGGPLSSARGPRPRAGSITQLQQTRPQSQTANRPHARSITGAAGAPRPSSGGGVRRSTTAGGRVTSPVGLDAASLGMATRGLLTSPQEENYTSVIVLPGSSVPPVVDAAASPPPYTDDAAAPSVFQYFLSPAHGWTWREWLHGGDSQSRPATTTSQPIRRGPQNPLLATGPLPQGPSSGATSSPALVNVQSVFVPTVETVQLEHFIRAGLAQNRPVLIMGVAGSGKTSGALSVLKQLRAETEDRMTWKRINMTQATSPQILQGYVEDLCEKRVGSTFGPRCNKQLALLIDDLHLAHVNAWGDQPAAELLRQVVEFGGCFALDRIGVWKSFVDIKYVGAMFADGTVPRRLRRHFWLYHMPLPSTVSMRKITTQLFRATLPASSDSTPHMQTIAESCVTAVLDIWGRCLAKLLPTPHRFYYNFCIRDVASIAQGLALASSGDSGGKLQTDTSGPSSPSSATASKLVSLVFHECRRVLGDRLNSTADQQWFSAALSAVAETHFGSVAALGRDVARVVDGAYFAPFVTSQFEAEEQENDVELALGGAGRPSGTGGSRAAAVSNSVAYVPISIEAARQLLLVGVGREASKRATGGKLRSGAGAATSKSRSAPNKGGNGAASPGDHHAVVLFHAAVEHVLRICRVLAMPQSHGLLLGAPGNGKQTLTRLAAYAQKCVFFQTRMTNNYNTAAWLDDMRQQIVYAGTTASVVFCVTEADIKDEAWLEVVNAVMLNGEVPGIFTPEDRESVLSTVRTLCKVQRRRDFEDSEDWLWQTFLQQVKERLHVVLCFSPQGDLLHSRHRRFPGLFAASTIIVCAPWPRDALAEVAASSLSRAVGKGDLPSSLNVEGLAAVFAEVHAQMEKLSEDYYLQSRRRSWVTSGLFLSFLLDFFRIYRYKDAQLARSLAVLTSGLEKLNNAEADVASMRTQLDVKEEKLRRAQEAAILLLDDIQSATAVAEGQQKEVAVVAQTLSADAARIQTARAEAEADLVAAQPALEAARRALEQISSNDMKTLKALSKPPELVRRIFDGVCLLFHGPISEVIPYVGARGRIMIQDSWQRGGRQLLSRMDFLDDMMSFNVKRKDRINDETCELLAPYLREDDFNYDRAYTACGNVAGLCTWVSAMVTYRAMSKYVAPKIVALTEAEGRLRIASAKLNAKREELERAEATLREWSAKLEEARLTKQQLEQDALATRRRVTYASELIAALADEKLRWLQQRKDAAVQRSELLGNTVSCASFLTYAMPLGPHARISAWQSVTSRLAATSFPVTDGLTFAAFLVSEQDVASWVAQGLPADDQSIENAVAISCGHKVPLLVDPQQQGQRWISAFIEENARVMAKASSSVDVGGGGGFGATILARSAKGQPQAPTAAPLQGRSTAASLAPSFASCQSLSVVARNGTPEYTKQLDRCMNQSAAMFVDSFQGLDPFTAAVAAYLSSQRHDLHDPAPGADAPLHPGAAMTPTSAADRPHVQIAETSSPSSIAGGAALASVVLLGDVYDVHPDFALVLSSKSPSLTFNAEVFANLLVIDFSITQRGLEQQLLARTVSHERPELEEERRHVMADIHAMSEQAEQCEAELLQKLSSSQGALVDDESLVLTLQQSKDTAVVLKDKLKAASLARERIDRARLEFESVAQRGTVLYFAACDLVTINFAYQLSLSRHMGLFARALKETALQSGFSPSSGSSAVAHRTQAIISQLTQLFISSVGRGLYEVHKPLFVFLVATKIELAAGRVSPGEVAAFLRGGSDRLYDEVIATRPHLFPWIKPVNWKHVAAVMDTVPSLSHLSDVIARNEVEFKRIVATDCPEAEPLPALGVVSSVVAEPAHLTRFKRLLVIRCLREDRIVAAAAAYVRDVLGPELVDVPAFDLATVCDECETARTPVLFLLSPGGDPTSTIEAVAKRQRKALHQCSMGQGQESMALALLVDATKAGDWVVFHNVHLSGAFLWQLDAWTRGSTIASPTARAASSARDGPSTPSTPATTSKASLSETESRIFLTAQDGDSLPLSLLQSCLRLSNDPPRGIQASVGRAVTWITRESFELYRRSEWRACLFAVSVLHGILLERRVYGPLGWSVPYQFNDTDFVAALSFLQSHFSTIGDYSLPASLSSTTNTDPAYVHAQQRALASLASKAEPVNWDAVRAMICGIHYGGRVTGSRDRLTLNALGEQLFQPAGGPAANGAAQGAPRNLTTLGPLLTGFSVPDAASCPDVVSFRQSIVHQFASAIRESGAGPASPAAVATAGPASPARIATAKGAPPVPTHPACVVGLHGNAAVSQLTRQAAAMTSSLLVMFQRSGALTSVAAGPPSGSTPTRARSGKGSSANDASRAALLTREAQVAITVEQLRGRLPPPFAAAALQAPNTSTAAAHQLAVPRRPGGAAGGSSVGGAVSVGAGGPSPLAIFFRLEAVRLNALIDAVHAMLEDVVLATAGSLAMTASCEQAVEAILSGSIPEVLLPHSWPGSASAGLNTWMATLQRRYEQLAMLIGVAATGPSGNRPASAAGAGPSSPLPGRSDRPPAVLWLGGFFNPRGLIQSVRQHIARRRGWMLDRVEARLEPTRIPAASAEGFGEGFVNPAEDGQYVSGLFLEGASFDDTKLLLRSSQPMELTRPLPVVLITASLIGATTSSSSSRNVGSSGAGSTAAEKAFAAAVAESGGFTETASFIGGGPLPGAVSSAPGNGGAAVAAGRTGGVGGGSSSAMPAAPVVRRSIRIPIYADSLRTEDSFIADVDLAHEEADAAVWTLRGTAVICPSVLE